MVEGEEGGREGANAEGSTWREGGEGGRQGWKEGRVEGWKEGVTGRECYEKEGVVTRRVSKGGSYMEGSGRRESHADHIKKYQ